MALIGIAFGVGFTLGPALGGLLYGIGNGQWVPAMAAAGFSAIALVMTYFFLEEPKERRASSTPQHTLFANLKFIKGRFVALILLIQLLYMIIFSGFETTFAVFTNYVFSFTERQNSLLFVFAGVMTMLVQGVITRRTFSNPKTMLLMGISFTSVAFALLASTQSITILLVGLAALSLGMGLVGAYLPSLLSTHVNSNIQGGAMGIYEGIGSLSRVIGPIATFGLFAFSPNGTYGLFAVALAIIGILILLIYSPKTKHDLPQH
jgi:MFS family permease